MKILNANKSDASAYVHSVKSHCVQEDLEHVRLKLFCIFYDLNEAFAGVKMFMLLFPFFVVGDDVDCIIRAHFIS